MKIKPLDKCFSYALYKQTRKVQLLIMFINANLTYICSTLGEIYRTLQNTFTKKKKKKLNIKTRRPTTYPNGV